jgi:hypothetical protein
MKSEKFNPLNKDYNRVEDLPESEQGNFTDLPEEQGGFVRREAAELYEKANRFAISEKMFTDNRTALDLLREDSLKEKSVADEAGIREEISDAGGNVVNFETVRRLSKEQEYTEFKNKYEYFFVTLARNIASEDPQNFRSNWSLFYSELQTPSSDPRSSFQANYENFKPLPREEAQKISEMYLEAVDEVVGEELRRVIRSGDTNKLKQTLDFVTYKDDPSSGRQDFKILIRKVFESEGVLHLLDQYNRESEATKNEKVPLYKRIGRILKGRG